MWLRPFFSHVQIDSKCEPKNTWSWLLQCKFCDFLPSYISFFLVISHSNASELICAVIRFGENVVASRNKPHRVTWLCWHDVWSLNSDLLTLKFVLQLRMSQETIVSVFVFIRLKTTHGVENRRRFLTPCVFSLSLLNDGCMRVQAVHRTDRQTTTRLTAVRNEPPLPGGPHNDNCIYQWVSFSSDITDRKIIVIFCSPDSQLTMMQIMIIIRWRNLGIFTTDGEKNNNNIVTNYKAVSYRAP